MTHLVRFQAGLGSDHLGRMLPEIQGWDDNRLERVHDYIQWLFPLPERSAFNAAAPVLSPEDVTAFLQSPPLRRSLLDSFQLMLRFYGFQLEGGSPPAVGPSARWAERSAGWLTAGNHNFLRITRILRCLTLLGLQPHAAAFLARLRDVYAGDGARVVGPVTMRYWEAAVHGR